MTQQQLECRNCGIPFLSHKKSRHYCSKSCQIGNEAGVKPYKRLYRLNHSAMNRAKTKKLPYDLDLDYLMNIYLDQEGRCAVSGVEFDLSITDIKQTPRWNAPSLDRVTPELGYVKGNVRIVCYQVNMAIGAYGLDQFLTLCKIVSDGGYS